VIPRWRKPVVRDPLPCDRKKNYPTYEEAVRIAIVLVEEGVAKFLTAYRCTDPRCRKFHLSSQPNRTGRFPGFEAEKPNPDVVGDDIEGRN
jgi:hypothetical protein